MKIIFDDKSYVECRKENDKIVLIIAAQDHQNHLKKITNAVELTQEEFDKLIGDIK